MNVTWIDKFKHMLHEEPMHRRPIMSFLFLAVVFGLALFNSALAIHCGQETGCVDPYWADFWLISFDDGYDRRALLGQLVRVFVDDRVSYVAINLASLMNIGFVFLLVLCLFVSAFGSSKNSLIAFAVLVAGPIGPLFLEVLGDPLHFAFTVFILYCFLLRLISSVTLIRFFALLTGLIVAFLHEASVFLFFPAIYVAYCMRILHKPNVFLLFAVVSLAVMMFVLLLNNQSAVSNGLSLITVAGADYTVSDGALPSFWALLEEEIGRYFGSPAGLYELGFKVLGAFLYPFLFVLALSARYGGKAALCLFLFLLVPSLPLYVIAHDWGRFAIYTLALTIVLCGFYGRGFSIQFPKRVVMIAEVLNRYARFIFEKPSSMLLLVLIYQSNPVYRIYGLPKHAVVIASIFLFLMLIMGYSKSLKDKVSS